MKTQVAIIGGGPSGLLLSQLLHVNGIDSIVIERQTREYVLARIRAGVLEDGTRKLLHEANVGDNLEKNGYIHHGVGIVFNEENFRLHFSELTGGQTVVVYGQTEVTKDLYEARDQMGGTILHEVSDVDIKDLTTNTPHVNFTHEGENKRIDCDFVIGCDGFHGPSRKHIPDDIRQEYINEMPFGWLGILSETPPVDEELIYAAHPRGFALCSMRHEMLSRYYIQVPVDDDINEWTDDKFWAELKRRLPKEVAERLVTGPSIEKSIAPLRSFVCEPMSWERLFLVGDSAHIVPPTGAKGLNLAVGDVNYMYKALIEYYKNGSDKGLKDYSDTALERVWKTERFSTLLTNLLHTFPDEQPFNAKIRQAQFDYLKMSKADQRSIAESYIGLPY